MNNRRKHERKNGDDIKVKIRRTFGDFDDRFYGIKNISLGGMLSSYTAEMNINEYVMLTINAYPQGLRQLIKCVALVKRVEAVDENYNIAFQYIKIDSGDVYNLQEALSKIQK